MRQRWSPLPSSYVKVSEWNCEKRSQKVTNLVKSLFRPDEGKLFWFEDLPAFVSEFDSNFALSTVW